MISCFYSFKVIQIFIIDVFFVFSFWNLLSSKRRNISLLINWNTIKHLLNQFLSRNWRNRKIQLGFLWSFSQSWLMLILMNWWLKRSIDIFSHLNSILKILSSLSQWGLPKQWIVFIIDHKFIHFFKSFLQRNIFFLRFELFWFLFLWVVVNIKDTLTWPIEYFRWFIFAKSSCSFKSFSFAWLHACQKWIWVDSMSLETFFYILWVPI